MKYLFKFLTALFLLTFGPRFLISDTDAGMHIIQFKDAVKQLAGGPDRSYLKEMVSHESCDGESALIAGSYKPNLTAGGKTALASVTNRYSYDQLGSPTLANAIDSLLTRNDTVESQRTQVLPELIDIGKWFDIAEKMFLELSDPTSKKLKNLMQGYWTKEDMSIITALFAATVTRVAGDASTPTTTAAVTMPTSQIMEDRTYADIDDKIFSDIKKRFMKQYVTGETIYAGFGPDAWEALVNNSGDRLNNQDYVDSAEYYMEGKLPKCKGVVPVVHPLFENSAILGSLLGTGEVGLIAGWSDDGICWAQFMEQQSHMEANSAAHKGQSVALIQQYANAARIDDLRVVQGAILEA